MIGLSVAFFASAYMALYIAFRFFSEAGRVIDMDEVRRRWGW
jgi:hypothetical protein